MTAPPTPQDGRPRVQGRTRDLVLLADRAILQLARHWLLLANLVVGLYAGLPVLAPVLMHLGYPGAGQFLYTLYIPNCHQLPERSFFLFGERAVYRLEDLPPEGQGPVAASSWADCIRGGWPGARQGTGLEPAPRRFYYGDERVGYKMAFCQRDFALYGAILLAGLLYGPLRRRIPPLPFLYFLILCVPLVVDGVAQLLGLWESTWFNRVLTGSLFGVASVWFAYPRVQEAMDALRADLEARLAAAARR
ncbi:MAG: DUF2085 domain-containing protein [Anaerolineae bacterium]|nr:DUF2085 domain-containing protein [Anaerolineae bacterium]